MPKLFATLIDEVQSGLANDTVYTDTTVTIELEKAIKEYSDYDYYEMMETFKIESRTGTADEDKSSALVDDVKTQFVSTAFDVGKEVYNTTDKTRAVVAAFVNTGELTLSKDIFPDGDENYEIFNKGCSNKYQVYIGDITDYVGYNHGVFAVEHPIGERRNFTVEGDILTIVVDSVADSGGTAPDVEVFVWFKKRHRVSQLSDLGGEVDYTDGYIAGSTSMVIDEIATEEVVTIDTLFTVAGIRGTYRVTSDIEIADSKAIVKFWPGLESAATNGDTVTFQGSTLTAVSERLVVELATAYCAINRGMNAISQVGEAITLLATINSTIDNMSARITLAMADIASGRTELAKTPAIITSAATAIGKVDAEVTQAVADLDAGRIEVAKIAAIIGTATGVLGKVDAEVTQAVADIDAGRTELAKTPALINLATLPIARAGAEVTQAIADLDAGRIEITKIAAIIGTATGVLGKVGAEVAQAIADLDTGRTEADKTPAIITKAEEAIALVQNQITPAIAQFHTGEALINEINKGGAGVPTSHANYATTALNNARAYADQARVNLQQATAEESATRTYSQLAQVGLASANGFIGEARAYLGQATADESLTRTYTAQAQGVLATAQGYLAEAQGFFNQATKDESISRSYTTQAQGVLATAVGYLNEAQGYFRQAAANESLTRTYVNQAQGVLASARGYLTEAEGYFTQVTKNESIARTYTSSGSAELNTATTSLSQAGGYIRELTSRLNVAASYRYYQDWGERRLAPVLFKLEKLQDKRKPRAKHTYSKD